MAIISYALGHENNSPVLILNHSFSATTIFKAVTLEICGSIWRKSLAILYGIDFIAHGLVGWFSFDWELIELSSNSSFLPIFG